MPEFPFAMRALQSCGTFSKRIKFDCPVLILLSAVAGGRFVFGRVVLRWKGEVESYIISNNLYSIAWFVVPLTCVVKLIVLSSLFRLVTSSSIIFLTW